jgi:hypothetical protein
MLLGLLLALLPLFNNGVREAPYPWPELLPADGLSRGISAAIRLLGMAAVTALLLGMAGLHRTGQSVERIDRVENQPLHYFERLPREELSDACYGWAALCIALLAGLKLCEVRRFGGSGF